MQENCNIIANDTMSEKERLEHVGVRPTAMRLLIYRMLRKSSHPMSLLDMETELETVERSTISRTLSIFLDHDIVHAIDDGSGSVKYEACRSAHHHSINDLHVHFHCTLCDKTFCLPIPVPEIELPQGFKTQHLNYVITGTCDKCTQKT